MHDDELVWPSASEATILKLLAERGPLYGLALVKASRGELRRASIYVKLERLLQKGLVSVRDDVVSDDYVGITRRLYELTELGARSLRAREAACRAWVGEDA
jgi:DNA-binding PadR family transcriptional regulator